MISEEKIHELLNLISVIEANLEQLQLEQLKKEKTAGKERAQQYVDVSLLKGKYPWSTVFTEGNRSDYAQNIENRYQLAYCLAPFLEQFSSRLGIEFRDLPEGIEHFNWHRCSLELTKKSEKQEKDLILLRPITTALDQPPSWKLHIGAIPLARTFVRWEQGLKILDCWIETIKYQRVVFYAILEPLARLAEFPFLLFSEERGGTAHAFSDFDFNFKKED